MGHEMVGSGVITMEAWHGLERKGVVFQTCNFIKHHLCEEEWKHARERERERKGVGWMDQLTLTVPHTHMYIYNYCSRAIARDYNIFLIMVVASSEQASLIRD